jgi:2,3-bisphosphoglycerate-independent phosphoglycerate mutase
MMRDVENNQAHTQHTTNLVPLTYVGRNATVTDGGALSDLAPTLLHMMGVVQPAEMTGKNLIQFK